MKYNIFNKEDYDKSFKVEDYKVACYSIDYFNDLPEDEIKIVGEMNKYKPDKDADNTIVIDEKSYPVCDPDDVNRMLYSCRGYVAVGENEYIAFYKSRLPFIFWLLGILLAGIIALILIFNSGNSPAAKVEPFNPLPPVDSNVQDIGDNKEVVENKEGGDVTLNYSPSATLTLSTKNIDIDFTNPSESTHELVIELYVISTQDDTQQEYPIAQSGRIPRGSRLTTMSFEANPEMFNGEGQYMARYHVKYYDPTTGEKSIVDSQLDNIVLTVQK